MANTLESVKREACLDRQARGGAGVALYRRWPAAVLVSCLAMASLEVSGSERFWSETRGEHDIFHRGEVIDEMELASLRGGFRIGGMELAFGAELTTRIDEQVQLVSLVNITPTGIDLVSRTLSDPTGKAALVGEGTGVRITDLTPNGVDLTGFAGFPGWPWRIPGALRRRFTRLPTMPS